MYYGKSPGASQATLRMTLCATLRDLAHHDSSRGVLVHMFGPRESARCALCTLSAWILSVLR